MTIILGLLLVGCLAKLVMYLRSWHFSNAQYITIVDGDSVRIYNPKQKIFIECRMTGYDSPEWNQIHGAQATKALRELLKDGMRWRIIGMDDYNRVLINGRNGKGSIARQMVAGGHGHNCANWGFHEFIARITRRGLWGKPERLHPRTFRTLTRDQ